MMQSVKLCSLLICLLFLSTATVLADVSTTPVFKPELTISKAKGSIDIDGNINESAWSSATMIDDFIERDPGENIKPNVKTEVLVTYDESFLYVAFKCYDNPALIRATMSQRDQYSGDDEVAVFIDPYANASSAYMLYVNSFGIQKDYLWNSVTGSESGFDLIWNASAKVTDFGYQVEMSIPFSSLRFPNQDVQTWKIDFRRGHPRDSYHTYAWAAYDRNDQCGPCQWGTVSGIKSVKPGKGVEILPAFVGDQNGYRVSPEKFENDDPNGEFALGAKYAVTSDVTVEAAYNPDFSQIEADAAQIDVNSTFSLFYPERRPYFQEGADIFRTLFNSFYTRTISDPKYTVKMTGRPGRTRFGFVSALDENSVYIVPLEERDVVAGLGDSYVNVLRGVTSFGANSRFGFILNDRRYDGTGSNTILGLDGDLSITRTLRWDFQTLYTYTDEGYHNEFDPDTVYNADSSIAYVEESMTFNEGKHTVDLDGESFDGIAFITRLRAGTRNYYIQLGYNQIEPTYRTQVGYDPVANHRTSDLYAQYTFYPQNSIFDRISPRTSAYKRWDFHDGTLRGEHYEVGLWTRLRYAQSTFYIQVARDAENYNGSYYGDITNFYIDWNSQPSAAIGYYFNITAGDGVARSFGVKSNEVYINAGINLKPDDRLFFEPEISFIKGSEKETEQELFQQYILRNRLRYQLNKNFSLRLVTQYVKTTILNQNSSSSINIDPLLTYRINPYTVFYIGAVSEYIKPYNSYTELGDPISYDTQLYQRKFFVKLQYLFQT